MEEIKYVGGGIPDGSPMCIGQQRLEYEVVIQYKSGGSSMGEGTYPTIEEARARKNYLTTETSSTILNDVEIHEITRKRVE